MDRQTFERALPAVQPRLYALAARLVGHPEEARDVVQEALLRAHKGLGDFAGDARLETWLYTITMRAAVDHLRARRRFSKQVMIDACDERGAVEIGKIFADPSVAFDVHEHVSFCLGCIGRSLEPEVAAALVLREMLGLSNDECARVAEVSESVHRHRLREGRARLTEEYEGLCALVRKDGACHQCRTLRDAAPAAQKGPPLPDVPLDIEARLRIARGAPLAGTRYDRLRQHFHEVSRAMNEAAPPAPGPDAGTDAGDS